MAHYDCRHCGASMGIAFGYCTECTTQDYTETKKALEKLSSELEQAYDKKVSPILEEIREGRRLAVSNDATIKKLRDKLREIEKRETGK